MKCILIAGLVFVSTFGTARGQDNTQINMNVEYAVHDGVSLVGDLYLPANAGPHPAMLLVHGGGFARGSKSSYGITWGPYLAAHGYVVFAIDYRLSKPAQPAWPQALLDCKAGLQYLRGRAAELGVDPDRIGVGGESAGGTLTALLAVTQDMPRFAGKYPKDLFASVSTKVKVAVPIFGAFDMTAQQKYNSGMPSSNRFEEQFIGGTPVDLPGTYFESSAINYVREAATKLGGVATPNPGTKIPWFLAWGEKDKVVLQEGQSVAFVQALREAGATVTAIPVPNVDHYWFSFTELTGKKGIPDCDEPMPARFSCKGATPNDYIVSQLMDFLSKNL